MPIDRLEFLGKVMTFAQLIIENIELEQTLQSALSAAREFTQADSGSLFLLDKTGDIRETLLNRGKVVPVVGKTLVSTVLDKGFAGHVLRSRQSIIIADTTTDNRWYNFPDQPSVVHSVLGVPVIRGEELLAILILSHSQPGHFTIEHTELIEASAGYLALALDHARAHADVKYELEQRKIIERQLQAEIGQRKIGEAALRKANLELQRLAVLDDLTQIANRRRFDQYLQIQWEQSPLTSLSLLLCDIDYFKCYNDNYGHPAGDQCLYQVAQTISRAVGSSQGLVARYGGEEFGIILPNTPQPEALEVAEAILSDILKLQFPHAYSAIAGCVTLSIGVASAIPVATKTPKILIAAADAALYKAKQQGRNRVVVSDEN